MIKIKALNDGSDSSDSSDDEFQVTREAEEEGLNKLYLNALKAASDGNTDGAIELLEELKEELETDMPKVKDVHLLKRLKYLTYKNLGLFKNDLNLILDALELDDNDCNLWITAGKSIWTVYPFFLMIPIFRPKKQRKVGLPTGQVLLRVGLQIQSEQLHCDRQFDGHLFCAQRSLQLRQHVFASIGN